MKESKKVIRHIKTGKYLGYDDSDNFTLLESKDEAIEFIGHYLAQDFISKIKDLPINDYEVTDR